MQESKHLMNHPNVECLMTFSPSSSENILSRIETRLMVSHSTPYAMPRMIIAGKTVTRVKARIEFLGGRSHLPVLHVEQI